MNKMWTTEEYKEKLRVVNDSVELIDEYKGAKVKVLFRCKKCGNEWMTRPALLLRGLSCPQCSKKTGGWRARKTNESFIEELKSVSPQLTPLEKYVNNKTKILFRCNVCGYQWKTMPWATLKGYGCPQCGGVMVPTQEEFLERLHNFNPDIEALSTYKNSKTFMKFRCNKCGYEWETTSHTLFASKNQGCPQCAGNVSPTPEEFEQKVKALLPDIEMLSMYKNSRTTVECLCNQCGHRWKTLPSTLMKGSGCPACFEASSHISRGEAKIERILKEKSIKFEQDVPSLSIWDCKDTPEIAHKRYDFIIFDEKGGIVGVIEYDGKQHFAPSKFGVKTYYETVKSDTVKTAYAEKEKWPLLRIRYDQIQKTEEIVNDFLNNKEKYAEQHNPYLNNQEYWSLRERFVTKKIESVSVS